MTFLTDVMKIGYSEDEIIAVLYETERDRKQRRRVLAKVTETVAAHRLQQIRDLLALEKLASWRRMNGFHRIMDSEIVGFMVLVRSHQRLKNSLRVCGPICKS